MADHKSDELLGAVVSDDVQRVGSSASTARGELIRAVWHHPGVKSVLLRTQMR